MALKAKVKSLSEVDAKYHDLYVENEDGTFRLDADGVEDVSALKNALERERELNKKKGGDNGNLTAAEKQELAELRAAREAQAQKDLESEKNWKGLEERLKTKHTSELTAAEQKAKAATERLHRTLKENVATAAIAKMKGKVAPLLPHVLQNLDVVEENGEYTVVVKGKDGNVRYSKENPKDVMSVEDLVKTDFLGNEDFMGVFDGKGFSGSGAQGGTNGQRNNGGTVTISREDARDTRKYAAAKEQANKLGQAAPVVLSS